MEISVDKTISLPSSFELLNLSLKQSADFFQKIFFFPFSSLPQEPINPFLDGHFT